MLQLKMSLSAGKVVRSRLLLRALGLGCVWGYVALDNFYALLESLLERAEALADTHSATANEAVFARQTVLAIMALSPWLACSSAVHARVFGDLEEGDVSSGFD
jgi:hypothetical protein